jgi:folate-dependent phosphoribosylglycinamide formyltransferase PurN
MTEERQRVGILTTKAHPLLPYLLERLDTSPLIEPVLAFDEKGFSDKDEAIFRERTAGAFPRKPLNPFLDRHEWLAVPDHNGPECVEHMRGRNVALLFNGGTPRRLTSPLLDVAPFGVLNVHPGILPRYRGATCPEWALYYGDPVGVSAHFMDAGLDSGPILMTRELPIAATQSYTAVRAALYAVSLDLAIEGIEKVLRGRISPRQLSPQPEGVTFKPIPPELLAEVKARLVKPRS